jgi:hypothetical protein
MVRRFLPWLFILTGITALLFSCRQAGFAWEEGDVLFQDGDCGDFCDAIREVTDGYGGRDFSHNGLLVRENDSWMVLEAVSRGVVLTPLDSFLNRAVDEKGNPKIVVGRLKQEYKSLIPPAITYARTHLGKGYDDAFDFGNDEYYCSELIHVAFKTAREGKDLFEPKPMTFLDPETGLLFPIWEDYFFKLGIEVPEGELGLNPGSMSLSPVLEIIEIN